MSAVMVMFLVIVPVDRLEDDGPAGGEDGMVDVQVIGFEGEASEDGRDGDGLAIG